MKTWFGTVATTVSYDPGPGKPAKGPNDDPSAWVNEGWGRYRSVAVVNGAIWWSNKSGTIMSTSQVEWAKLFAAAIWAKLGLTALIAAPPTDWLNEEDTTTVGKALGADGWDTWTPQPPSTLIPMNYLVYDAGAHEIWRPAGGDLQILRLNGPGMGFNILRSNLLGGRAADDPWVPVFNELDPWLDGLDMRP